MPSRLSKVLVGFAAGVMVSASFWGLLQPALEEAADMGSLAFAVGFVLMMTLDVTLG